MAKKNETQQQAAQGDGTQQQPQYRYNESMINWEQLKNFGLSREELQERGLLDQMLRGYKTNQVVPISMNFGSAVLRTDARLSFQQSRSGDIVLGIHGIRQKPDLDRPYFGHIFSDEDKKNLLETGNMGRVVELKNRNGEYVPSFVSIDKLTNEVVAMKAENVFIPREISGVELTEQEQNDLREGKKIFVEGMTARSGNPFDAHLQVNAERRGVEFIFENDKLFNRQSLGGVELTKKQIDDLNEGKAIFVEGMKRKDGELFSSYVKLDEATGRPSYTRYNPDSPEGAREIYIPNEINGVKITPEEQKELREGRPIFLNDMVNRKGRGILLVHQGGPRNGQAELLRAPGTASTSARSSRYRPRYGTWSLPASSVPTSKAARRCWSRASRGMTARPSRSTSRRTSTRADWTSTTRIPTADATPRSATWCPPHKDRERKTANPGGEHSLTVKAKKRMLNPKESEHGNEQGKQHAFQGGGRELGRAGSHRHPEG